MDADLYVPGDGWLHRADPRVKFLISVAMLVLCYGRFSTLPAHMCCGAGGG